MGATIGNITISALGFADDLLLISDTPEKLQKLIIICETWSKINHMPFKISKCKIMALNRLPPDVVFKLFGNVLQIVNCHKYIRITLSTRNITNLYVDHFNSVLDKAKKRLRQIKHVGFTRDGLRPETALKLYKLLIRPILEYGGQILTYVYTYVKSIRSKVKSLDEITGFVKKLEHFQTQALKNLLGAPKSTSPAIVRLFAGVEPFSSRLDLLKLRYFWKKFDLENTTQDISSKIISYRKKFFLGTSNGFIHEIFNLCCKYKLMDLWHGNLSDGRIIANKVRVYNLASDLEFGRKFPCCFTDIYLSNVFSYQESYHLVKPFKTFNFFPSIDIRRCIIKVLLYPRTFETNCCYCNGKFKDILKHFVFDCPSISLQRKRMTDKLKMYNYPQSTHNIKKFVAVTLENKLWVTCLAEFLTEIKFYRKCEDNRASETLVNP